MHYSVAITTHHMPNIKRACGNKRHNYSPWTTPVGHHQNVMSILCTYDPDHTYYMRCDGIYSRIQHTPKTLLFVYIFVQKLYFLNKTNYL